MPEMDQWSPNTMVKYGLSRVDSNGDIVSIWNFGELDRALREIQSDDEEDTVYTSAAHESGSVTNSYVMIDGELRLSARYLDDEMPALEKPEEDGEALLELQSLMTNEQGSGVDVMVNCFVDSAHEFLDGEGSTKAFAARWIPQILLHFALFRAISLSECISVEDHVDLLYIIVQISTYAATVRMTVL
ncbi:hypothetical protein M758_UG067300 [Ceratodon purpureus]|nr:hypothetical protein M758_UG067300 [Ceratodon purpureus]